jgi:hypothetical protein
MALVLVADWIVQTANVAFGISAILFPVLFILVFALHPGLLKPRLVKNEDDIMKRVRNNKVMHGGHVLMILSVPLLILTAIKMISLTQFGELAWLGFAGGVAAMAGAIFLAVDKGALCLVVSAFDTLSDEDFAMLKPGFRTMSQKASWLKLVWGIMLLPVGFIILGDCWPERPSFCTVGGRLLDRGCVAPVRAGRIRNHQSGWFDPLDRCIDTHGIKLVRPSLNLVQYDMFLIPVMLYKRSNFLPA